MLLLYWELWILQIILFPIIVLAQQCDGFVVNCQFHSQTKNSTRLFSFSSHSYPPFIQFGYPTLTLANFIIVQLIELAIGLRPKYFLDPSNNMSLILDYGFDRYGLSQDLCVLSVYL